MGDRTIIVGGGLAGLAAAAALAERGISVCLLESRQRLGGRASSFYDRTSDSWVDNCQHVNMGCCTNFQHFCETLGLQSLFRSETVLNFVGPDGTICELKAGPLPAPFHLAAATRNLGYLSRRDLMRIGRALSKLARTPCDGRNDLPFDQWLANHGQTTNAIDRFWQVVLVSALGETLDRIDVMSARKVFTDAFLRNRHGWYVQIPTVPLQQLYGRVLTDWLSRRGATIRLGCRVKRIAVDRGRAKGVELDDGDRLAAEHVIVAVPQFRLLSLLPESLSAHPQLAGIDRIETAPISSVHLWFDRPLTKLAHCVFVERMSQWMFNRSVLQRSEICENQELRDTESARPDSATPAESYYYQIVISASRNLSDLSQDAVVGQVVQELTDVWPAAGAAKLLHARLLTEHKAVFSSRPGVDALRPAQQSPIENLQIAGDWTATGWPATMEGAVRSGYLAAENILQQSGRPEKLIQPDLPTAILSKVLLGL